MLSGIEVLCHSSIKFRKKEIIYFDPFNIQESIKEADVIFVLDDGKISGFGTHEKLLAENEIYREVYESQQQGSGDADLEGAADLEGGN